MPQVTVPGSGFQHLINEYHHKYVRWAFRESFYLLNLIFENYLKQNTTFSLQIIYTALKNKSHKQYWNGKLPKQYSTQKQKTLPILITSMAKSKSEKNEN